MRYIFLVIGIVLLLLGALKVYGVFLRPNVGPELMADATFRALGAIVCFAIFAKSGKKKTG
jgi:uncharacterized membrane protein